MKRRTGYLLTLIICLFSSTSWAQTRGFSRMPETFIEELGAHVKKVNVAHVNSSYDAFAEKWKLGVYSEAQQAAIMKISEDMLLKEFKIEPDFNLFMKTLVAGKDSSIANIKFDNWVQQARKLVRTNRESYLHFMKVSYLMFSESALYKDDSKTWIYETEDYQFNYDKENITVSMQNITLKCKGQDDYIIINATSGVFDLNANTWTGEKGRINWERVGLSSADVFAEFDRYKIDLSKGEVMIDTVRFQYAGILEGTLEGKLIDRVTSGRIDGNRKDFLDARYPQFQSFRSDLTLGTFNEGQVKYKGGFELHGNKILGTGTKDIPAVFEFYYEDKLVIEALSKGFSIDTTSVRAAETEVTIFTDSGEIYHPMLDFTFRVKDNTLYLLRGDEGIQKSPFFDSDHNIEIKVDQIVWELDKPVINFAMLQGESKAQFASKNYFREFEYERVRMGMMSYNPLTKIQQYCIAHRSKEFYIEDYAIGIGSTVENLLQQMYMLADQGFIYFDDESGLIRVKEKLFNYVKNHFKIADYDVIHFNSVIAARPNAILNLVNYDLKIEGVRVFRFSDSQNVIVYPYDQQITLKNDRRMLFGGKITAGRFDFFGKSFDFDYNKFYVTSPQIDSMKLYYPDTINQMYLIPIKSVLRDLHGTLYIDKPNNKSGLEDHPDYPIFESKGYCAIAYDKKSIHNGAYVKDIFRFEVDPFTIKNIDNFTIEGLKFPGTFISGGILPEFRYEAYIMKDYSLGFQRANPPGGYEMYGGKGHGNIDISISEEGFYSKGEIEYEGATITSNNMVMMPDSLNAEVQSYTINENELYPNLTALNVTTHWKPKSDSMMINTQGHSVDVFREGQTFTGNLVHTPMKLTGGGKLDFANARMVSKHVRFGPNYAEADTASVTIGDLHQEIISFASNNVKAHLDFDNQIVDMTTNVIGNLTEFPLNKFAASLDNYHWDITKETIELFATDRLTPEQSYFVSRKPEQHGLSFQCPNALFNMKELTIYAEEVPFIDIADSRLFPDQGKVVIEQDAKILPFENARFLASRDNKYHELYECSITVHGKYNIAGTGKYIYKDKHKTGQELFFDRLVVNRDTTVLAEGYIADTAEFTVSPKIAYYGKVELLSSEEFLKFIGFAKPLHTFSAYPSVWFKFVDRPIPNDVILDASNPIDKDRKKLAVAMSISRNDSINVYPSFINYKSTYTDLDLMIDTGVLFYDESLNTFFCGDSDRLFNGTYDGSYMSLNEDSRMIESYGKIDLGLDLHESFKAVTAGKISKHEDDTTFLVETLMGLNMSLPKECYDQLLEVIKANSGNISAGADNDFVKSALAEFLDAKDFKKTREELMSSGEIVLPSSFKQNLLFTDMKFYYSWPQQGFVSYSPVQLASVNGEQVNQEFKSRLLMNEKGQVHASSCILKYQNTTGSFLNITVAT